jgi:nucleotidyltransferase substrate binding protein (TIGR01987 family)
MSEADQRWHLSLEKLGKSLSRLEEALNGQQQSAILVDATIQRFENCIELFWKTFRHLLALEGRETFSPKESLQAAYQLGWLHDEQAWLGMLKDRNLTSHTYNELLAEQIVHHVRIYYPEMKQTFEFLKNRFQ